MSFVSSACVFCGSRIGKDPAFLEAAEDLADGLVKRHIDLVYGAGSVGLMGAVADRVLARGGKVRGVIPDFLQKLEVGHDGLDELHVTTNMHERKMKMFDMSDAFIVLPGGLGTLDETFEIITWRQLGLHDKPVVILDVKDCWAPFVDLVERVIDNGFASEKARGLFVRVTSIEDALEALRAAPNPANPGDSSRF